MRLVLTIYCLLLIPLSILHTQSIFIANPRPVYFVDDTVQLIFQPNNFKFADLLGYGISEKYFFGRISLADNNYSLKIPYVRSKNLQVVANFENYSEPVLLWHKENAHTSEIRSIVFAARDFALVTANANEVNFWDIANRRLIKTINLQQFGQIRFVLPAQSADTLFVGTVNGIYMFDVARIEIKDIVQGLFSGNVRRIAHHPTKKIIAFGADSGFVAVFDYQKFDFVRAYRVDLSADRSEIYSIDFSSTGDSLLCGAYNGSLYLINTVTDEIRKFGSHGSGNQNTVVFDVAFVQGSPLALSAAADGKVRSWLLSDFSLSREIDLHTSHVRTVVASENGKYFVSGSLDSNLNFVDLLTGSLFYQYKYNSQLIYSSISSNGKYLAASARDGSFVLLQMPEITSRKDTITLNCGYKFYARLQDIHAKFGEKKIVELKVNHNYLPNRMPYNRYFFELQGNYPSYLLYWDNELLPGKLKHNMSGDVSGGVAEKLNFLALGSQTGNSTITIDTIIATNPDFYYFFGEPSTVEVLPNCSWENGKSITIDDEPEINAKYSNNILSLNLFLVEQGKYNLQIFDITGRLVSSSETVYLTNGFNEISLKMNLSDGIYFINLISESGYILNTRFIADN
ncbi:MAG: T9SS type A sorting domain-containing protein [Bacteroidota bacterium]